MDDSVLAPATLTELGLLTRRASSVIERLRERVFAPNSEKRLDLVFNVRTAAEMVGRTEKAIRDAEADGRLPDPDKDPQTGRRTGYTLAQVK